MRHRLMQGDRLLLQGDGPSVRVIYNNLICRDQFATQADYENYLSFMASSLDVEKIIPEELVIETEEP